jgi:hypothetical protein
VRIFTGVLGALIMFSVFAFLTVIMAAHGGWLEVLRAWAFSIGLTSVIVIGVGLLVSCITKN